jgi:selenocysteine-specific elongation factor
VRVRAQRFPFIVQSLVKAGDVSFNGALVGLPTHAAKLAVADDKLWTRIAPLLSAARFRPPRVVDLATDLGTPEANVRRLMKLVGRMGMVNEIAPDHFFLRDTIAEMVEIAADIAAKSPGGEFSAAQFRDRLDNGRKVAIQILEFFDRHGVTLRRGDLRRINPQKRALFAKPGTGVTSKSTAAA